MAAENIKKVIDSVAAHRQAEDRAKMTNRAVARYAVLNNGKPDTYWMTLKPNNAGVQAPREGIGTTTIAVGRKTTIEPPVGRNCSRDSKMGGFLIMTSAWETTFTQNNGKKVDLRFFSRCHYQPDYRAYSGDASAIQVELPGHKQPYRLNSLKQYLAEAKVDTDRNAALLAELIRKNKENRQKEDLEARLAAFEVEQEAKREEKARNQRLIKEQTLLRMKPILDEHQERVKRSGFYDGTTVIINGGPGTGKTTSLIQRIKFFTDPAVIEEYLTDLSSKVKGEIIGGVDESWMFLSPSPLLKAYLKEAMGQEGLKSTDSTVQVWDNYRSALIKQYGLISTDKSNAFLAYRKHENRPFFLQYGKGIKTYAEEFRQHLILATRKLFGKATEFERAEFHYATEVARVQRLIKEHNSKSMLGLVNLLEALKDGPGKELAAGGFEFNEALREAVIRIQVLSTQDEDRQELLYDIIRELSESPEAGSEEEDDDEDDDLLENVEEEQALTDLAIEKKLNGKIRSIVIKLASGSIGQKVKFTASEEEMMLFLVGTDQIEARELRYIGETVLFRRVFGPILRGTASILLNRIPAHYKSYRKTWYDQPRAGVIAISTLKTLVEDGNKRLHPDEQSFLPGFINNLLKDIYRSMKSYYNGLKHNYKEAYTENTRRVIAVDEASDFSLADIYAIESMLMPEYSSLTLCGDIMQRITTSGINEWEDVYSILNKVEENDLEISYRQSPTLLGIASDIFERTTGKKSHYRPFMKSVDNEPAGLLMTSDDEKEKVEWIADRVVDIYRSLGDSVPSIAIFLPTGGSLTNFARDLGETDTLADVDIKVMACVDGQALGDKRTVRVFDIKHIKGLEFEAAFFHNIDDTLESGYTPDMLLRNLYVGLSRATFYSAITTKRELPEELVFLGEHFEVGGTW